ncbi:MAG: S-layer homology domain-containing protein [Clostridia bacterium]|nr:S-layer homology domain-containing protein [Clostridia bacterium]
MKKKHLYRLISLFCILPLLSTFLIPAWAADTKYEFRDVSPKDWYYSYASEVCSLGLMIGTGEDRFSPANLITSLEAVTLLARLHARSVKDGETALSGFTAKGGKWYQGYFDYCLAKGLLLQNQADMLISMAGEPISRAMLLDIFSTLPPSFWVEINTVSDNMIPDVSNGHPSAPSIYRAYRSGIVIGIDDKGTFDPAGLISRAEVAAIVVRMANPAKRLSVNLGGSEVTLWSADGHSVTVPRKDSAALIALGWREQKYPEKFDLEALLNDAILTPTKTGYEPLDKMVDAVFAKILNDKMSTAEKVQACYDYLVANFTYGSSPVAGKYRPIYKSNPYASMDPARKVKSAPSMSADRGYYYWLVALQDHALEGYTAMYAAEMLDGKVGWCDHYSSAFAVMMLRIGLPCFPLYVNSLLGSTYEPHMTTIMTVGGVDLNFDPQIEAVIVKSSGSNKHKRYGKMLSELSKELKNFDHLEDCRALFGECSYTASSMEKVMKAK